MLKALTRTGNSLALVLDRPLLEATGIDADTELEASTDGDVILIHPRRAEERRARLSEAVEAMHRRYGGVFRRLAE